MFFRFGVFVGDGAGAFEVGGMFAERVLALDVEEFVKSVGFDAFDSARSDGVFAFLVLFDVAFLEKHLQKVGIVFVEVFELPQDVIAIFEEVLGDFVEDSVGGQWAKLLRAIPFREFKDRHGFNTHEPRPNTTTVRSSCGLRPAACLWTASTNRVPICLGVFGQSLRASWIPSRPKSFSSTFFDSSTPSVFKRTQSPGLSEKVLHS